MSAKIKTASELIGAIDELKPLDENVGLVMTFMIDSCGLLTDHLPPVARDALDVARRYWTGATSVAELESARVRCWQYLDDIGSTTALIGPHVCATRAVICLLYPAPERDGMFDAAHWFLELTRKVADIDRQQCEILARVFEVAPDALAFERRT